MDTKLLLPSIEVNPQGPVQRTVIWLHGLGADGHDFEGIVPQLNLPPELGFRFVFPHAPSRPVTVNNGMVMPAWYDIGALDLSQGEDAEGIRESADRLMMLVQREQDAGIASNNIVLAGFSQGGAIALHGGLRCSQRLAGIMGLSTYLALPEQLADEIQTADVQAPLFMGHGIDDTVVPIGAAEKAGQRLKEHGYNVVFRRYPMPHSVCAEEIGDIRSWLIEIARD